MIQNNTEIVGGVKIADDIKNKVQTTGIRGLDIEKAQELGVFKRLANLFCVIHASIMAAYRVYGGVEYMLDQMNARKNEIAKEMNAFEKAYDHFVRFWTDYYAKGKTGKEVAFETENLYHKIMEWMQMPEAWQLGDEQRTPCGKDLAIRVDMPNEKVFTFYKTELSNDVIESNETWGVLCYDPQTNIQVCENADMDKASAMMVAKRLSVENPTKIYSVSIIRNVLERKTEVVPFKAVKNNETIGKLIR